MLRRDCLSETAETGARERRRAIILRQRQPGIGACRQPTCTCPINMIEGPRNSVIASTHCLALDPAHSPTCATETCNCGHPGGCECWNCEVKWD